MEDLDYNMQIEYGLGTTIVTFHDDKILEEHQIKKLEQGLTIVINKNKDGELLLNFSNVRFMSSSVLGLLVKIHKRVNELNGHLKLSNVNSDIYKVFKITQLTKVFDMVNAG